MVHAVFCKIRFVNAFHLLKLTAVRITGIPQGTADQFIYAITCIIFIIFHRKCLVSDIPEGTIATVSDGFHGISDRTVKIKNCCFYHKITPLL